MLKRTYYCDRCGKKKNRTKDFAIPINSREKMVDGITWITLRSSTGYQFDLDLCDDCMEEFTNWMTNLHGEFCDPDDMNKFEP